MFVCITRNLVCRPSESKKRLCFLTSLASSTSLLNSSCKQPYVLQFKSTAYNKEQFILRSGNTVKRSYSLLTTSFPAVENSRISNVVGIKMISDENISPNKIPKAKKAGKTIEETYQKKTQLEHILLRYVFFIFDILCGH